MGCIESKSRVVRSPTSSSPSPSEAFVGSVASSYWAAVKRWCPANTQTLEWQAFLCTCSYLVSQEFGVTEGDRINALNVAYQLCPGAPDDVKIDNVKDDSLGALLEAWSTHSTETETVGRDAAAAVLKQAKVYRKLPSKQVDFSFGDLLVLSLQWTASTGLGDVFEEFARGASALSAEQLAAFLSYGADHAVSVDEAEDMIRRRLGGAVTKLRFLSFFGNPASNDVLDPQRALSVWQDMSQPLTHYSIATRTVQTLADLVKAISENVRAFVVAITATDSNGEPLISTGFSLSQALQLLRSTVFVTNALPVVLCFQPTAAFNVTVQDRVADMLHLELGPQIAAGLMFRGEGLDDIKFTPTGLQHRFLVMAQQGPLKPFVGFSVADMQRTGIGVRVTNVPDGTPAARAGVAKTDWITHLNGEQVESLQDFKSKLGNLALGEEFRLRKEGVTEVSGIVGAAVPANTERVSKKLSALLFLNYDATVKPDQMPLPWDTTLATLPTPPPPAAAAGQSSPNRGVTNSPLPLSDGEQLVAEAGVDHFRFIPQAQVAAGKDSEDQERAIASADLDGIQFIDTAASPAASRWSRGKFQDNGHCGYVLHRRGQNALQVLNASSHQHHNPASGHLGGRQQSTGFGSHAGGPNAPHRAHDVSGNGAISLGLPSSAASPYSDDPMDDSLALSHPPQPSPLAPARVHFEIELHAVPREKLTTPTGEGPRAMPTGAPPSPAHGAEHMCSMALIGTPERREVPLAEHAVLDVNDPQGKVLLLRTRTVEGVELEAALPADLIRPGYRIVSFVRADGKEENSHVYPVLCAVKRKLLSPVASRGTPQLPQITT